MEEDLNFLTCVKNNLYFCMSHIFQFDDLTCQDVIQKISFVGKQIIAII